MRNISKAWNHLKLNFTAPQNDVPGVSPAVAELILLQAQSDENVAKWVT